MLSLNSSIFTSLLSSPPSITLLTNSGISTLATQTTITESRAENLLRRLDGTATLVRSILDWKALETLQASSRTSAELAQLARDDSVVSNHLARKATQDARTLKSITILTLVYLPASFVATLLGTQYINVQKNSASEHISIQVSSNLWIFFVLTVLLLLATVGGWLFWEWRNKVFDRTAAQREKGAKIV